MTRSPNRHRSPLRPATYFEWKLIRYGPLGIFLTAFAVIFLLLTEAASTEPPGFTEEGVVFQADGTTLGGTILVPDGPGLMPGMVLVHGAGNHDRDALRLEAEEFARRGVVTLIYDKRDDGYSDFERSFVQLAGDVAAAAAVLAAHPSVDDAAVGVWGVSEGAWVAPIAAQRPDLNSDIDFLVLVAPTGVSPAQQHAWFLEGRLRAHGVEGSLIETLTYRELRFVIGMGFFPEPFHDPVGPLRDLRQPVLALWGDEDTIQPPAESARIVAATLREAGNPAAELVTVPGAGHDLRSENGLAGDYPDRVAAFAHQVAAGQAAGATADPGIPDQTHRSRRHPPLGWWESAWGHLAFSVLLIGGFGFAGLSARRLGSPTAYRWTRIASAAAVLAILGTTVYLGYLAIDAATGVGPVFGNRAVLWIGLQAMGLVGLGGTVISAVAELRGSRGPTNRVAAWLVLGALFGGWAWYWGLLSP